MNEGHVIFGILICRVETKSPIIFVHVKGHMRSLKEKRRKSCGLLVNTISQHMDGEHFHI